MTAIATDPLPSRDHPSVFALDCASCGARYDALQAEWCLCIVKERTLLCPHCGECFCRSEIGYKRSVWMSAPEALWGRKQRAAREQSELFENPQPENVRRPLVLVVDDDHEIRALTTHLINGWGFGCIHAANGTDGLSLARRYRPELILTDALMPKMDGRELCRLVKADPELSGTRVVIMSSVYTSGRFKREALSHFKADEYLAKPVAASSLYRLIRPEESNEEPGDGMAIAEPADDPWVSMAGIADSPLPLLSTDSANDVSMPFVPRFSAQESAILELAASESAELELAEPEPAVTKTPELELAAAEPEQDRPLIDPEPARLRLSARELIRLRALGLDSELAALGNAASQLRTVDLVVARTAGVPVEFLSALDPELLTTLAAAEVIMLYSAGCAAETINVLRRLEFTPRDIIGVVASGVPLGFIEGLVRVAARPFAAGELVRLHAAGTELDYVRAIRSSRGDDCTVDDLVRLWTLGVTPDFIHGAAESLSSECSIEELIQLWLSGVDLALLEQVRAGI
jgi:CheY-like chemotaxis protein